MLQWSRRISISWIAQKRDAMVAGHVNFVAKNATSMRQLQWAANCLSLREAETRMAR